MKKKIRKIFWWAIFIIFVAPSLVCGISDLISGIGCDKFESGVIWDESNNDDENFFKTIEFEPSLWTKIDPMEGWDNPPEWLKEWLEAQKK